MPLTQIEIPILQSFFCVVEGVTGMPPQPLDASPQQLLQQQQKRDGDGTPKKLPKGVVLGPDGKP
jgi:FAD-linked sulfhydryl oxidase